MSSQIPPETLKAALELWGQSGETHYLPLRGSSMLPLLRDGDQVLVSHHLENLQRGDIVVFQRSGGLLAHRVLCVLVGDSRKALITKGDHALKLDPRITQEELIGRVLAIRRGERQMNIDTPAWRACGRLISSLMRTQVWLYQYASKAEDNIKTRISTLLSRGTLWLGVFLINICQVVFGRWKMDIPR
jgi:hypothetical protein